MRARIILFVVISIFVWGWFGFGEDPAPEESDSPEVAAPLSSPIVDQMLILKDNKFVIGEACQFDFKLSQSAKSTILKQMTMKYDILTTTSMARKIELKQGTLVLVKSEELVTLQNLEKLSSLTINLSAQETARLKPGTVNISIRYWHNYNNSEGHGGVNNAGITTERIIKKP
jgi:hypothetical protein